MKTAMTIGEAARESGVNAKLIRYYESIGLIPAAGRTASGYRLYTAGDVNVLRFIRRARRLGFGIGRIQALVALWQDRGRSSAEVKRVALAHVAELDARIAELRAIRDTLAELAAACHGDERPDCPILRDLAEGDAALAELLDEHPGADRQRLRQLVRSTLEERKRNKPPRAFRELFRELRALLLAGGAGEAAAHAHADDAADSDGFDFDEAGKGFDPGDDD